METEDKRIFTATHYLLIYPMSSDIEKMNLEKYGLKIYKITDKRFTDIYDGELKRRFEESQLKDIETLGLQDLCYVISEERKLEEPRGNKVYEFLSFLQMIKPSELNPICSCDITYVEENNEKKRWQITISTEYQAQDLTENKGKLLELYGKLDLTERLLENYFKVNANKNLEHLMDVYITAIRAKQPFVRFLMFVMMAEMLVVDDTNTGVSYKIRRVCAVLLGNDNKDSELLFENLKNIYEVRSKIVHSAEFNKLTWEKIDYMHTLACEILNTFLLGAIDLNQLFRTSTKYGFGQRQQFLVEFGIASDERFEDNIKRLSVTISK